MTEAMQVNQVNEVRSPGLGRKMKKEQIQKHFLDKNLDMHVNSLSKQSQNKDLPSAHPHKQHPDSFGYNEGFQITQVAFTQRSNIHRGKQPKTENVRLPTISGAAPNNLERKMSDTSVVSRGIDDRTYDFSSL